MKPLWFSRWSLAALLVGLAVLLNACSGGEEPLAMASEQPVKVVPVAVKTLAAEDLVETFTLPASLEAWEDLTLAAEIAGPVRKVNFEEGDRVSAGSVLLAIDSENLQSNLAREEKNHAVTARKVERYRQLRQEGLVSQQELDELQNSLTAAAANLQTSRIQLAKSTLKAPVSGVVDRLLVDRGEYVEVGKPLLRLVQVDRLKVIVDVPEKDVAFLKTGQRVQVIPATINNRPVEPVTGTIAHIAFSADERTRTYRTKILVENPTEHLRPGMIVRAEFVRQQIPQAIAVPMYAVLDRGGEKQVFVAEGEVARRVVVKTSNALGEQLVITEGLEPGMQLVVKGQQLLAEGSLIAPEEAR